MNIEQEILYIEKLAGSYESARRYSKWGQYTKDTYKKWNTALQEFILTHCGENNEVYLRLSRQPIDRWGDKISETFDYVMNQKWASLKNNVLAKQLLQKNIEPIQQIGDSVYNIVTTIPRKKEPEPSKKQNKDVVSSNVNNSNKNVFIVHGHDKSMKTAVKKYIASLGLKPIILSERANRNMTILAKLQAEAKDVAFAVVLYTPCDEGREFGIEAELTRRARENVVLELGYFSALLPKKVAILLKRPKNVLFDFPNDFRGVGYIEYNNREWKENLKKELKEAGLL